MWSSSRKSLDPFLSLKSRWYEKSPMISDKKRKDVDQTLMSHSHIRKVVRELESKLMGRVCQKKLRG